MLFNFYCPLAVCFKASPPPPNKVLVSTCSSWEVFLYCCFNHCFPGGCVMKMLLWTSQGGSGSFPTARGAVLCFKAGNALRAQGERNGFAGEVPVAPHTAGILWDESPTRARGWLVREESRGASMDGCFTEIAWLTNASFSTLYWCKINCYHYNSYYLI